MAPYRDEISLERHAAEAAAGRVELEVAPDHLRLSVGAATILVGARELVRIREARGRRREHRRGFAIGDGRIVLARGHPGRALALWLEVAPGVIERVFGISPRSLLDDGGLDAGRALDRLASRLAEALGARATAATELGKGGHRVVLVERDDRLVLFARPLFRERPRRCFEVCADGTLVLPARGGDRRARFTSRFDVIAAGDRIRIAGAGGADVASLFLPWIAPEDRAELARRIAERVDPAPLIEQRASPDAHPAAAAALSSRIGGGWPLPMSRVTR